MLKLKMFKPDRGPEKEEFPQAEFIEAVRQGGVAMERAIGDFVTRYKGCQWTFYKRYWNLSQEDVIDVFTDAVMKIISYIRLGKLDESYRLSTYIYRIMNNLCIDCLRSKGAGKNLTTEEIPEIPIQDHSQNLLHQLLMNEAFQSVMGLLDNLKGNCKELILRWGYWGYSMKEIADYMHYASPEAVSVVKGRCLKRLRSSMRQISEVSPLTVD